MIFKKWATSWAEGICAAAGEKDSYRIALIRYVLESMLSMILSITFIVILAYICGVLATAILLSASGAFIKAFTGGLHSSTPLRCAILGAIFAVVLSFLAKAFPLTNMPVYVIILILIWWNIIVWLKAPVESQKKPLTKAQKRTLAILSKVIMTIITAICLKWPGAWGVNELFYGIGFQVIGLTSIAETSIRQLDKCLALIERHPIL
ncbi:MAG: accessory gene regulator ArgB-like protein [Bacillota bacterium]